MSICPECAICCLILESKSHFLLVSFHRFVLHSPLIALYSRKYLDFTEVEYLINVIWNFHPSKSTIKGMKKLELNKDGTTTIEEFELLCYHYPEILYPLVETRKILRKKLIFPRFWKELTVKRSEYCQLLNILEITGWDKNNIDYATLSMEYLNLRIDDVPHAFIDQWKTTQRKKEHSYQGNVELPYELFEEKKQLIDKFAEDDLSTIF